MLSKTLGRWHLLRPSVVGVDFGGFLFFSVRVVLLGETNWIGATEQRV